MTYRFSLEPGYTLLVEVAPVSPDVTLATGLHNCLGLLTLIRIAVAAGAGSRPRCCGLIGQEVDPEEFAGDLAGTPYFVGCSDSDPHIPVERVHVTAEVMERLNADVEKRIYEGMGHAVNEDEREYVDGMVARLLL